MSRLTNTSVSGFMHVQRKRFSLEKGSIELDIHFRQREGGVGRIRVPGSIQARPMLIFEKLLEFDAFLPLTQALALEQIRAMLREDPLRPAIRETVRCGWHGSTFVDTFWSEGNKASGLKFDRSKLLRKERRPKGSLEEWRTGLKGLCKRSSFGSVAVGIGFTGSLLKYADQNEGFMLNFYGESSTGKSLAARLCQSVFASARGNDLATYDILPTAMEELCFARCDSAVVLDEQGRLDGGPQAQRNATRKIAYQVASGKGRLRSKVAAHLPPLTWRAVGISSGEISLDDLGEKRNSGETIRHIEVPIPPLDMNGIFDRAETRRAAIKYAAKAEKAIARNFGQALRPFIQFVITHKAEVKEVIEVETAWMSDRYGGDAFALRRAKKFGLISAAMVLAARAKVAPWDEAHARRSVMAVFRSSIRGSQSADVAAVDVLDDLAVQLDSSRWFPKATKGAPLRDTREIRGFLWQHPTHGQIAAIKPKCFEALAGARHAEVLDILLGDGRAISDPSGKRHLQIAASALGAKRRRWVALPMTAFKG